MGNFARQLNDMIRCQNDSCQIHKHSTVENILYHINGNYYYLFAFTKKNVII